MGLIKNIVDKFGLVKARDINEIKDAMISNDIYLEGKIDTNNSGSTTRMDNHVNGIYEKHNATDINFTPTVNIPVNNVQNAIEKTDERVSNIIAQSGTSDTEVVDARQSATLGETFTVLKDRFENIESKQMVDSYSSIQKIIENVSSVPTETLDSSMLYQAKGLSIFNVVKNADFSDGTNGWNSTYSTISVTNNILSITGDGTSAYPYIKSDNLCSANSTDEIFLYFKVRVESGCNEIRAYSYRNGLNGNFLSFPSPTADVYTEIYGILTYGDDSQLGVGIQHRYADASTANGKVMEVDGNAGVWAINMTQLGLDTILSDAGYVTDEQQEQAMLNIVRNLDAGTTDIQSAVLDYVSVGKNLFDKNTSILNYSLNGDGYSAPANGYAHSDYIKVNELVDITIQGRTHTQIEFYDNNKQFISGITGTQTTTTPKNTMYVRFNFSMMDNADLIQFELGTSATEYEPYKQNTLKLDTDLKSLPNGTRDEIRNAVEVNGTFMPLDKPEKVQRIKTHVLEEGDIVSLITTRTNMDLAIMNKPLDGSGYNDLSTDWILINSFPETHVNGDIAENIGKFTCLDAPTQLYFMVAKGTYADLAEAQADLAGTVIQYELATPIITQPSISELYAFENGTIYNNSISELDYVVSQNKSAMISRLNDTVEKIDDDYASKNVEEWIEPTLLNGWVNRSGSKTAFYKNNFGEISVDIQIQDGIATIGTTIFVLPEGYRPKNGYIIINGYRIADGSTTYCLVYFNGEVKIGANNGASAFVFNGNFRAEG